MTSSGSPEPALDPETKAEAKKPTGLGQRASPAGHSLDAGVGRRRRALCQGLWTAAAATERSVGTRQSLGGVQLVGTELSRDATCSPPDTSGRLPPFALSDTCQAAVTLRTVRLLRPVWDARQGCSQAQSDRGLRLQ